MKNYLILLVAMCIVKTSVSQVGFYRNIYGDYNDPYSDSPQLNSINKLSEGRYFITGHAGSPYRTHFSGTLLDADFNTVWTSSFEKSVSGPSNYMQYGAELTDKSIVSLAYYDSRNVIVRHDADGNFIHSNYYGTEIATDYSTGAICASTLDDTGYVAMFAECAIKCGLFKFDQDGNVMWAYEYGTGANLGNIYEVEQAINTGYILTGIENDLSGDTAHYSGFALTTFDDGTINHSKKYMYPTNEYNLIQLNRVGVSLNDNSYYASCYYGKNHPGVPVSYTRDAHILQLDSTLNITMDFQLSSPDENVAVLVDNIAASPDNTIILTGRLKNSVDHPSTQFFILKLNPYMSGGDIQWCKVFWPLSTDVDYLATYTIPGLFTHGENNEILTSYVASSDQGVIASIDANGEGLCIAEDKMLTVTTVSNLIAVDHAMIASPRSPSPFPHDLVAYDENHKDTMLCYINTLEIPTQESEQAELVIINYNEALASVQNLSNQPVAVEVFNLAGQLVYTINLGAFERRTLNLQQGIFVCLARQNNVVQKDKFIVY